MTKPVRIVGGVLALVGGAVAILAAMIHFNEFKQGLFTLNTALTFVVVVVGMVGGILLLINKTGGAILALGVGVLSLLGVFIQIYEPGYGYGQLVFTVSVIDPLLLIIGGILGLVAGSE